MEWEVINVEVSIPRCDFCNEYTKQMARFIKRGIQTKFICSNCARFVKDCMNKWEGLKEHHYLEDVGKDFSSKLIDELNVGDGGPDPMGKFNEPVGKDLTLDDKPTDKYVCKCGKCGKLFPDMCECDDKCPKCGRGKDEDCDIEEPHDNEGHI